MKDLIKKISESNEPLSALYLEKEDEKSWTIDVKGSKKLASFDNKISLSWDPHSGIYFIGPYEKLQELQKFIKEKTIIEKDSI